MIEVLSFVAEPGEGERLSSPNPEARAQGREGALRPLDPAPATGREEALIESFPRVRHAGARFRGFGRLALVSPSLE